MSVKGFPGEQTVDRSPLMLTVDAHAVWFLTALCVSLVLKGQGADWLRPAPGRPAVQEEEDLRVCDAERSHPPALVASGVIWINVSEQAILSSVAHYATLTRPGERKHDAHEKRDKLEE